MPETQGSSLSSFLDPRLLLPPDTTRLIARPELLSHNGRLPLVVAPAGYGKSSLLAQWASSQSETRWLTLPPAADEPAFLFAALAAAANLPQPAQKLTPELVEALVARPLVLDDCHHVSSAESRRALDALADAFPADRLALGSRTQLEWPALGRRRVRRELSEIGPSQLAFRGEALSRLAEDALALPLDDATRDALESATDGWAALVVLAALWLEDVPAPRRQDALRRAFAHSDAALYDYLAAEVLDALPPDVRRFALDASPRPRLTPETLDPAMLRELDRRRLLIRADDGLTRVFHPLLATFLKARLREECGEAEYGRRCVALARELLGKGGWPDAFPLLREVGAWREIAAYLEGGTEWFLFRSWLRAIPEDAMDDCPVLQLRRGNAHTDAREYADAERLFQSAQAIYERRGDGAGVLRVMVSRARALRTARRYPEAAALGDALEARWDEANPEGRYGIAYHQAILAVNYHHDLERAKRWQDTLVALAEVRGRRESVTNALLHRAATLRRWAGDFDGQEADLARVEALYDDAPPGPVAAPLIAVRLASAWVRRTPETATLLDACLAASEEAGVRSVRDYALGVRALLLARDGDPAEARAALVEASPDLPVSLARALLAARLGDRSALAEAIALPEDDMERAAGAPLAEALLLAGDNAGAAVLARACREAAATMGFRFDEAIAGFWESLASGDAALAARALALFLAHGWEETLIRHPAGQAARFLALALTRTDAPDACRALIERLGEPTALVRVFGELEVVWNGKVAVWPRPKARALFAYLLLADGRPVPVERVVDALWPDADLEKGRQSYRTHCSYLRQALGPDCLETTHESVRLVLPRATLDQRVQLRRAHASTSPELWEAALQNVGDGEFLPEFLYEDWSAQERDTLHRLRDELCRRADTHPFDLV